MRYKAESEDKEKIHELDWYCADAERRTDESNVQDK